MFFLLIRYKWFFSSRCFKEYLKDSGNIFRTIKTSAGVVTWPKFPTLNQHHEKYLYLKHESSSVWDVYSTVTVSKYCCFMVWRNTVLHSYYYYYYHCYYHQFRYRRSVNTHGQINIVTHSPAECFWYRREKIKI